MKPFYLTVIQGFLLSFFLVLIGCSPQIDTSETTEKLKVVATTTIVGDVVSRVGGDLIDLSVLLPVGTDPHGFTPAPQDIARIADADVVFSNGAGLEGFLDDLIENAGAKDINIGVSEGVEYLESDLEEHAEGEHGAENEGEQDEHDVDPHTWTDPDNVMIWVENISTKLSELDPQNAETYQANAEKYTSELMELDSWIRSQVAQITAEERNLVTDHQMFGYFSNRYGFKQVGALIAGYSTLSEPSAQEIAALEDIINQIGVKAIFVGNTINPSLAERIAEDTGTNLVFVYTGSLGSPGEDADSYISYMRYNTSAFVEALR